MLAVSASARASTSAGPISPNTYGRWSWGKGAGRRAGGLFERERVTLVAERGRGVERLGFARGDRDAGLGGVAPGSVAVDRQRSGTALTTTGPELHTDAVLERERGVDELVHRCLLGERHERHPAPGRVRQQLDDLLGLGGTGPTGIASSRPRGEGGR